MAMTAKVRPLNTRLVRCLPVTVSSTSALSRNRAFVQFILFRQHFWDGVHGVNGVYVMKMANAYDIASA